MKSKSTKFEKVSLEELKKILPETQLNGLGKRATDQPSRPPTRSKRKSKVGS